MFLIKILLLIKLKKDYVLFSSIIIEKNKIDNELKSYL